MGEGAYPGATAAPPNIAYSLGVKVLVVEDDVKLAGFLVRALTEEGFDVALARTGGEALAAVEAAPPGLILLDWMIPAPDGLEICRQIRAQGLTLPIMLLTARGELDDRVLGLDTGADDYLVKPFELEELIARLRALLRRTGKDDRTQIGAIRLEWKERMAFAHDRQLDLTSREFDLLAFFVRHPGEVISKSDLLQRVWRIAFEPGTNVVEVHISRLRSKMGDAGALIETVRGGGYRLRTGRG